MNSGVIEQYQRVVTQLNENSAANDNGGGGGVGSASRTTSSSAVDSLLPLRYSHLRSSAVFDGADHETVQKLFAQLPFAATRSGEELHPVRAALSDALRENNREQEADLAGDPSKHLLLDYDGPESGWSLRHHTFHGGANAGWNQNDGHSAFVDADPATQQYLETALWSSTYHGDPEETEGDEDRDGDPLGRHFSVHDFSPNAVARAHHDVQRFRSSLSPEALEAFDGVEGFGEGLDHLGPHRLWLSRNGHGVSFADDSFEDHSDELDDKAEAMGEQDVEHSWHSSDDGDLEPAALHLHGGR